MEETANTNVEARTQEPENVETPTLEQLQEQLHKQSAMVDQLSSSNERLLTQSKDWKSKYSEIRDNIETTEKSKLEEQENWKELLDREKNEKFDMQEKFKTLKQQTVRANLQFAAAKYATDAWNVDDVIGSLPSELVEIGEDLNVAGIEDAVRAVREKKPYLFKQEQSAGMVSSRPGGAPKPVDYKNMSIEEKLSLATEMELKSRS